MPESGEGPKPEEQQITPPDGEAASTLSRDSMRTEPYRKPMNEVPDAQGGADLNLPFLDHLAGKAGAGEASHTAESAPTVTRPDGTVVSAEKAFAPINQYRRPMNAPKGEK